MYITKGSEFVWPKPKENLLPLQGYECKITNYIESPVFNLEIALQEEFRECIRDQKQPNEMHEGQITLLREWPFNIQKIDTGIGNAFIFYIFNVSDKLVFVSIPDSVTLTLADNTVKNVRLMHSGPMEFWPQLNLPALANP